MDNLRKAALLRWNKKLKQDLSKIPNDNDSLIIKSALCGFLAGDGSVQVRKEKPEHNYYRYQLDFFPDDEEMLNTYLLFIKKIYSLSPKITKRNNVYNVRTSQKFIVYDLTKLCRFGLYKWDFPLQLFKVEGAKEAWLRGFFSAEAYVGKKVVKTQSVNIKSIKKVRSLLKGIGIKSNYCEYISKNPRHSKVGMIFINEKRSRLIYYEKIGFWHNRKTKKLKESCAPS